MTVFLAACTRGMICSSATLTCPLYIYRTNSSTILSWTVHFYWKFGKFLDTVGSNEKWVVIWQKNGAAFVWWAHSRLSSQSKTVGVCMKCATFGLSTGGKQAGDRDSLALPGTLIYRYINVLEYSCSPEKYFFPPKGKCAKLSQICYRIALLVWNVPPPKKNHYFSIAIKCSYTNALNWMSIECWVRRTNLDVPDDYDGVLVVGEGGEQGPEVGGTSRQNHPNKTKKGLKSQYV